MQFGVLSHILVIAICTFDSFLKLTLENSVHSVLPAECPQVSTGLRVLCRCLQLMQSSHVHNTMFCSVQAITNAHQFFS